MFDDQFNINLIHFMLQNEVTKLKKYEHTGSAKITLQLKNEIQTYILNELQRISDPKKRQTEISKI